MLARCVIIRVHLSYSRRRTSIDPPTDTYHTIHITWRSMVKVTRLSLPCFLENALAFISSVPRLILVKGLGHLLLLSYPIYFACLLLFCCLNQKPLNIYLRVFAALSLSSVTYQHLLLLVVSILLFIENIKLIP